MLHSYICRFLCLLFVTKCLICYQAIDQCVLVNKTLLESLVHQLVGSADQLKVVVPHELRRNLGTKQPARTPGGDGPVLNLGK